MSRREFFFKKLIRSSLFIHLLAVTTGKSKAEAAQFISRLFAPRQAGHLGVALAALGTRKRLNIIQVGANDGVTGDPIYKDVLKYADRALLIEPQEWLIEDLKNAYKDFSGELIVENIAIGPRGGGSRTAYS